MLIYSRLMPSMKLLSNLWVWPKKGFQPHLSVNSMFPMPLSKKLICWTQNWNFPVQQTSFPREITTWLCKAFIILPHWESILSNTDTTFCSFLSFCKLERLHNHTSQNYDNKIVPTILFSEITFLPSRERKVSTRSVLNKRNRAVEKGPWACLGIQRNQSLCF